MKEELFLFVILKIMLCNSFFIHPETNMNVTEVISYYGYPCKTYTVVTDDGYILTLIRIPNGKNNAETNPKPTAFLQHGLLDSSFTWVSNPPSQSLAFILADNGYDVWLGNSRGNTYSRAHSTLSTSSNAYWDFTWNDMAKYDLPASIDYVLKITGQVKLNYIGHSQGTEIAFAKLGENGLLNNKISSFIALAPVAYLGNIKTAIRFLTGTSDLINLGSQILTGGEFLPSNDLINKLTPLLCANPDTVEICSNVLFLIAGYNPANMNNSRVAIYVAHAPSGTSSKNVNHYSQSYLSNKFQKYDYGLFQNQFHYNSWFPPLYNLNTYGVPTALFYGGNDWLASPKDVNRTILELGASATYTSYLPSYNHFDFVWGINAATDVYKDAMNFMNKYR